MLLVQQSPFGASLLRPSASFAVTAAPTPLQPSFKADTFQSSQLRASGGIQALTVEGGRANLFLLHFGATENEKTTAFKALQAWRERNPTAKVASVAAELKAFLQQQAPNLQVADLSFQPSFVTKRTEVAHYLKAATTTLAHAMNAHPGLGTLTDANTPLLIVEHHGPTTHKRLDAMAKALQTAAN